LRSAGVAARAFASSKARIAAASAGPSSGAAPGPVWWRNGSGVGRTRFAAGALDRSSISSIEPSFVVVWDW
jgi:hypothetical protein